MLVEIAYSGACGTQVMEARGLKGEDKWVPHCLGHEGTGMVLEIGSSVTKVKPGDRVVLSWIKGSGIDAGGAVYGWGERKVNAGAVTTFQRHAVVSENRLTPVPLELPLDIAVLLGCAAPTGMGSVYNVLKMKAGESVAIFGAGGIGLNACVVIDPVNSDVVQELKSIVPGGVDVAVEASGIPEVMDQAINSTRQQGGRAVIVGNAKYGSVLKLNPSVFNQGKSMMGTWGGDSVPDRDYGRYGRLLSTNRFPIKELLSRPYSLTNVNSALNDLEAGRVGRPLIDMTL